MHRPIPGIYRKVSTAGEAFQAFVPAALPPEPVIEWSADLRRRFDDALVVAGLTVFAFAGLTLALVAARARDQLAQPG